MSEIANMTLDRVSKAVDEIKWLHDKLELTPPKKPEISNAQIAEQKRVKWLEEMKSKNKKPFVIPGPEDLIAVDAMLKRLTVDAHDGQYNHDFVHEFCLFAAELKKFFNATGALERIDALRPSVEPDAQAQMGNFLRLCSEHSIPCSSFQLSSGYTSIRGKRYVFNWNHDKFPDPKAFTASYTAAGVALAANIKPFD